MWYKLLFSFPVLHLQGTKKSSFQKNPIRLMILYLVPSPKPPSVWITFRLVDSTLHIQVCWLCLLTQLYVALGTDQIFYFFCISHPSNSYRALQAGRFNKYLLTWQRKTTVHFHISSALWQEGLAASWVPGVYQGYLHQHLLWKQHAKITPFLPRTPCPPTPYSNMSSLSAFQKCRPTGKGRKRSIAKKKPKKLTLLGSLTTPVL